MSVTAQHILIFSTCFFSFLITERSAAKSNSHNLDSIIFQNGSMGIWQLRTLYGLLLFGCATLYYLAKSNSDFLFMAYQQDDRLYAKTIIYVLIMLFLAKTKPADQVLQTRGSSIKNIIPYITLQVPFLISVELFFRGTLLFAIREIIGPIGSVIINTVTYGLIHLHEKKKQILWSSFHSIILCVICLDVQSVVPAVIIRLAVSLINELRLFRVNQLLNH